MKKIFLFVLLAGMLSACHIASEEPEIKENESSYEAYGLLTIPSSGFTKEDVVQSIKEFIPHFEHEEKGKNLDQKM